MIKAILFDLDGVLVDACEWHYQALNKSLYKNCNITISREDHINTFNGLPTNTKLEILEKKGLIDKKQFKKIWKDKQSLTIDCIEENSSIDHQKIMLHEKLKSMGITIVCVTNSIRQTASLMLEKTGQIEYFKFIVTNEDVDNPKPSPECYEKARQKLSLEKEEILIVEDSDKGYEAAIKSGCNVLRVKDPSEVNEINILNNIKAY